MKRVILVFIGILLAASGWRVLGITFDSLWLDEGYQTMVDAYGVPPLDQRLLVKSSQPYVLHFQEMKPAPPENMLANFRRVDPLTPPLYQLLLNRWIDMFGGSDLTVRSLSVGISLISLSATFWLAYALFGLPVASVTGLLQAFSPFDVYYAQEVRMYELEQLAATLSCGALFLYLLKRRPSPQRFILLFVYAAGTWALINSHYTGLFVVAFQVVLAVLYVVARRSLAMLVELLGAWALTALLWMPWFGLFKQAAALRKASFYVARKPSVWWPFYAMFLRIPANWIVFLTGKHVALPAVPIFATAFGALTSSVYATIKPAKHFFQLHQKLLCLWSWALLPALGMWLVDVVENHEVVVVSRYLMATTPAILILAGYGLTQTRIKRRWLVALLAAHLLFASVNNIAHAFWWRQREPWREMAKLVEASVPSDELLVVAEWYDVVTLDRYLTKPYRQVGLSPSQGARYFAEILNGERRFALVTGQKGDDLVRKNMVPARFHLTRQPIDLGHSLHLFLYSE